MLSVVIAAYNEKGNLEELTRRFIDVFKQSKIKDYEFIYVIQGEDGTYQSMLDLKKELKIRNLSMFYYKRPLGVGPSFKVGFNKISKRSDLVVTMDGDLNHQPEELPSFIKKMRVTGADVVIGSRKVKGGKMDRYPFWKEILSGFTNNLLPNLFRLDIKDITSGYRLFRSDVIRKIRSKIISNNFEFYPEVLIRAKKEGFKMVETPIYFKYRVRGKSKLNFLKSGLGYLGLLLKIFLKK